MPSEPATGQQLYHGETLTLGKASAVLGAGVFTIYAVQIALYWAGMLELAAAAVADLAVLVGIGFYARARRLGLPALGLRRAAPAQVAAGVLVGISAWYVNLVVVSLVQPPGDMSGLQTIVEQTPLVTTLLAIALLPAVTEEILFRGIFTRAVATRFRTPLALVIAAAVFAVYHLLPPQMLSTFCLGLVLGFITLRARSIVPSIVAHLLNNAIAVVVSRDEIAGLTPWMTAHGGIMLVSSTLLLASGIALSARGPHE